MKGLIVTGEASGDLYGSRLAGVLKRRLPRLELAGMGGPEMAATGVQLLYHFGDVSVVGVFEVASKLRNLRQAYSRIENWVLEEKPHFAILIDFPDFNFRIARLLKRQGIPVFYFISPQIWAWRKSRIHFLKDNIKHMISILPFERNLYEAEGIPVTYVGHPLVEIVREKVSRETPYVKRQKPLVGIMPGSREVEVRRHLPILSRALSLIQMKLDIDTIAVWPPWLDRHAYPTESWLQLQTENRYAAMQACDLMLVTSGTSTLEAAILGVPLFIVYKVGSVSWQLGKWLVRVPYYGLVNWIAGEKRIPEYIQDRMDPELLASDAAAFLGDTGRQAEMKVALTNIVEALGPPGAIERAVDVILKEL